MIQKLSKISMTTLLIAVNIFLYIAMVILSQNSLFNPETYTLFQWGGLLSPAVIYDHEWWRLLSTLFVHAGVIHLFVNCYSLYNVGPFLEMTVGKSRFLLLYFLTGLASSINACYWTPNELVVGASGAIFGIFAAQMGLFIKYRKHLPRETYKSIVRSLIIVLAINLIIGFSLPNISNAGHLGGLISGFIFSFFPFFSKRFFRILPLFY